MVSTRRQSKGFKEDATLVLRSKDSPESERHTGTTADLHGERDRSSKQQRMAGVVIPQSRDSSLIPRSPDNSLNAQGVEEDASGGSQATSNLDPNPQHGGPNEVTEKIQRNHAIVSTEEQGYVDSPGTKIAPQSKHLHFNEHTTAEKGNISSPVNEAREDAHRDMQQGDSGEEAAPEVAGTSQPEGFNPGRLTTQKVRRKKKTLKPDLGSTANEHVPSESTPYESPLLETDQQAANSASSAVNKKRKLLATIDDKPRKDIVKGNVTYRFQQGQSASATTLPSKQNPISCQAKAALLKRKKVAPFKKPKFVRAYS
ncbi:MAG: hypothetical protein Q9227_003171 [Pyrenula ochraceoflavens]